MNKRLIALAGLFVTLALPVFLVLSSANLFMSSQFVTYEYGKPDFPPSARFDPTSRTRDSVATVRYTRGDLNDTQLASLGVYNDRELAHMRDVQVLAGQMLNANYLLGLMIGLALFGLWRASAPGVVWGWLLRGSLLTVLLIAAIGLFALFAFDAFFVLFHRLFFVGDSWLFPVTDSLIQFYPEPFWVDAALGIALATLLEGLALLSIAFGLKRRALKVHA